LHLPRFTEPDIGYWAPMGGKVSATCRL